MEIVVLDEGLCDFAEVLNIVDLDAELVMSFALFYQLLQVFSLIKLV